MFLNENYPERLRTFAKNYMQIERDYMELKMLFKKMIIIQKNKDCFSAESIEKKRGKNTGNIMNN